MESQISLYVAGRRACFTRPEFKAERVSYDFPPPTAARGILESVYWKPQVKYAIRSIAILKPIRWEVQTCNERKGFFGAPVAEYTQRTSRILVDVAYVIRATLIAQDDNQKHFEMFNRRARKGQSFRQVSLGRNEYPATEFGLPTEDHKPLRINQDFGWMLHSIEYEHGFSPTPFRAVAVEGVVAV